MVLAAAPKRLAGSACSADDGRPGLVASCIEREACRFSEAGTVSGGSMAVNLAGAFRLEYDELGAIDVYLGLPHLPARTTCLYGRWTNHSLLLRYACVHFAREP